MIALRLFGGASLESDGDALRGPATQRHRLALLGLLCVSHPRPLSRDKLMGYLWPERDATRARRLLNQALHVLRKTLGEDAIVSAGDELRLASPPLECDVLAFEEALATGDLVRATRLYAGPLLDGFFLDDAAEFEHWLDDERERLRREWRNAMAELAEQRLAAGDAAGADACWRRLLLDDPHDARATVGLMQALESLGDRAGALRQAHLHQLLLEEDFGAGPDSEVRTLADRIRSGAAGDPAANAAASLTSTAEKVDAAEPGDAAGVGTAAAPGAIEPVASSRWSWRHTAGAAAALLALGTLAWASTRPLAPRPSEITRIAVLPLSNLTGDPRQDYFVAGMHDALISELARVGALTVYSRQSVLRYANSDLPLPAIAKELGVDAVVEGAVFKSGDSVRISVQLVRAQPEQQLISETFTGSLDRALALHGKVARAVAEVTRARLPAAVRKRLESERAVDPAAREAYLSGLYHLEHATYGEALPPAEAEAEIRRAIAKLEEAVALDSTWAAAYAKLALADHWLASGPWGGAEAYYPRSKAAALRAIQLDPAEAQAYASLGFVLLYHELDWQGAERAIRRANELDPNSHHWIYALYLAAAGRPEAIAEFRAAEERDPASYVLKSQVATAYGCAGRYEEAIAQARALHARVAAPDTARVVGGTRWLRYFTARQYSLAGAHDEAIDAAQRYLALTDTPTAGPLLAFTLAMGGRRDEARSVLAAMDTTWARGFGGGQADVFAALGDTVRALDAVARLVKASEGQVVYPRCWPVYTLLRDDPRFGELLRPLGLPNP